MRRFSLLLTFLIPLLFIYSVKSQEVDLEKGLIAYYPFNEDAQNHHGDKLNGEVSGAQLKPEVRCGDGAYHFDGDQDYIDFGHDEVFNDPFRGLTVSLMFFYEEAPVEDFRLLLGKWAFDKNRDQFALFLSEQDKLSFTVADGEQFGYGVYSNTVFEPYKWYHIIAIWNRSRKMGIFVNGKLDRVGEQHGDGFNLNSTVSLKAGRQIIGGNRPFPGYLDEIRIYNRSLSLEEVKALYLLDNMVCNQFTLRGYVYNKNTNQPLEATIIFEDLETGDEFINIKSDSITGYYETKLPIGYRYAFYAKADNFISINENVSTENIRHNAEIERDLYLVPIEVGGTVRLNNIFFDFNKATLQEESFPELQRLIKLFDQIPGLVIELGGHTDSVGSDEYNLNLSNERANAVRDYLLENGIDSTKVVAKGYGETVPVATNDTDEGRQLNRRVEFKILEKD